MSLEYITSKNLFMLICDTLKMIDKRVIDHGTRVGYIFMEMLHKKGGLEEFEVADFVLLAIMHDIGAYKTDKITNKMEYDVKNYMPHSIYGYLFLKYLSPVEDRSKIILYHHIDTKQLQNANYEYAEITEYLKISEIVDIWFNIYGEKFDYHMLEKYIGKKYSKEAYDLMCQTAESSKMFEKLSSGEYQGEIEELLEYVLFSDTEKEKYLKMLMYSTGLRSEYTVVDTVSCTCIAREIGAHMKVGELEQKDIYYGALLHDLGMLSIPKDILDSPRKLTEEEIALVRTHVDKTREVLEGRFSHEIVNIACRHHERLDGSGYPMHLKGTQMNIKENIVQIADTVVGMTNERAYRPRKEKKEVTQILYDEMRKSHYDERVVNTFIGNYDDIMNKVKVRSEASLVMHKKLLNQFNIVHKNFTK